MKSGDELYWNARAQQSEMGSCETCQGNSTVVTHLAESIEDAVEEDEDVAAGHLGDVVHGLARKVPHAWIRIGETRQNGRHQLCQVGPNALEVLRRGDYYITRAWIGLEREVEEGHRMQRFSPATVG